MEQVLFPAFGISPNLGPAREAGTWRGEVVRLLALWEERWREAEGHMRGHPMRGPAGMAKASLRLMVRHRVGVSEAGLPIRV